MSPEQAMGRVKSITVASDVYGLGAILYAVLTGSAPFQADSDLVTLRRVIEDPPPSPRSQRPEIDRNLENICLKCLEKQPASRYASARHLADDLECYLNREPVLARPVGTIERRWRWCRRNPALATVSIFSVLLLIAIVLMSGGFAWREYHARVEAEYLQRREVVLHEPVDRARVKSESYGLAARKALGDLYTANGLWTARMDLHGESLLWFARAAQLTGLDPEQVAASKTRCLSWMAESPKPLAAWNLDVTSDHDALCRDLKSWTMCPGRSDVIGKSGSSFWIWRFETGEFWRPEDHGLEVTAAAWNDDGTGLAIGCKDGEVRLLDAATLAVMFTIDLSGQINSLAFSHSEHRIAAGAGKQLYIWDYETDESPKTGWQVTDELNAVVFCPDDSLVAAVTEDRKITVFDTSDESGLPTMGTACFVSANPSETSDTSPKFSVDGRILFVRSERELLRFLDPLTGKEHRRPMNTGRARSLAVSPLDRLCIVGGETYARVRSWNQTLDEPPTLVTHHERLAHGDAVTAIAFGGKNLVATAGRDQIVQLWRIGEPQPAGVSWNDRMVPLALLPHMEQIAGLLFSADGRVLTTVQKDGLVRV